MIELNPLVSFLSLVIPALLIAWVVGIVVGEFLGRIPRLRVFVSPAMWIVLLSTSALVPSFNQGLANVGPLSRVFLSPPFWLPLSLLVALLWAAERQATALRASLAVAWLLSLGTAVANQSMSVAVEEIVLTPRWTSWLAYGVIGLSLDRSAEALVPRAIKRLQRPASGQASPSAWPLLLAGFIAAILGLGIIGLATNDPLLSQAFADILQGLGSSGASGREYMALPRPTEWLGSLIALASVFLAVVVSSRVVGWIPEHGLAQALLRGLVGVSLYGFLLTIAFPYALIRQDAIPSLAQFLVLILPVTAYVINLAEKENSRITLAPGGILLSWMLLIGWMPLLGWSTVGDRIYILAAFLGGNGLPGLVLGQAVLATAFGGLVKLAEDRWLKGSD